MAEQAAADRRTEAMETAFGLFLRFGYRKTSMDEIARAVGVSRQALYLWFPNKKALFSDMVDHIMTQSGRAIEQALSSDKSDPERIVDAFDAYAGDMVVAGRDPAALDELLEASMRMVGDRAAAFNQSFRDGLAGVVAPYATEHRTADELAQVIYLAAKGAKHAVDGREAYLDVVRLTAELVCQTRS